MTPAARRRPARRLARRQVRARLRPRLPDRRPGARPPPDPAAPARHAGGAQHRRLRLRLSRLAARRPRPGAVEGAEVPRSRAHQVPARPERGPRRHRDLGLAAGQPVQGRERRRRVRDVVRQGPRRRPLRRRVQARELRRHVEARRRAGARRRRPRGEIVDAAAPVRSPVLGGDDAGAVSVVGAGDPRSRPARLGDEPLLRLLGRLQVRRRHRRELGVGLRRRRSRRRSSFPTTSRCRPTACRSAGPTRSSRPKRGCRTTRSTRRCTTAASTG